MVKAPLCSCASSPDPGGVLLLGEAGRGAITVACWEPQAGL